MSGKAGVHSKRLHLIERGIGKQLLFEENEDYLYGLTLIDRFRMEADVPKHDDPQALNIIHDKLHLKSGTALQGIAAA